MDPVGGSLTDPQSWQGYAYARNNPLRFVDPLGMNAIDGNPCDGADPTCYDGEEYYCWMNGCGGHFAMSAIQAEVIASYEFAVDRYWGLVSTGWIDDGTGFLTTEVQTTVAGPFAPKVEPAFLSAAATNAAKTEIASGIDRINQRWSTLTPLEQATIMNVKTIYVRAVGQQAQPNPPSGMTIPAPMVIGESPAWAGSIIAHESYHLAQIARGQMPPPPDASLGQRRVFEAPAFEFHVTVGRKLELSDAEIRRVRASLP